MLGNFFLCTQPANQLRFSAASSSIQAWRVEQICYSRHWWRGMNCTKSKLVALSKRWHSSLTAWLSGPPPSTFSLLSWAPLGAAPIPPAQSFFFPVPILFFSFFIVVPCPTQAWSSAYRREMLCDVFTSIPVTLSLAELSTGLRNWSGRTQQDGWRYQEIWGIWVDSLLETPGVLVWGLF